MFNKAVFNFSKDAPSLYTLKQLQMQNESQTCINGKWVPARPLGLYSIKNRIRLAWLVFTGKCDVLKWPEGQ